MQKIAPPPGVKSCIQIASAAEFEFPAKSFDLVVSLNTLHNLELPALIKALKNIEAASRANKFICVESYRNEVEKWNLLRWQLTCESFFSPSAWEWIFKEANYSGDYEFIYFT